MKLSLLNANQTRFTGIARAKYVAINKTFSFATQLISRTLNLIVQFNASASIECIQEKRIKVCTCFILHALYLRYSSRATQQNK